MKRPVSIITQITHWPPKAKSSPRTIRLTDKGRKALEYARRKRLYPELDPEKDWIEIPMWMLDDKLH